MGHTTRAFDETASRNARGVADPFWAETCTMSNKGLNRDFLGQAMSEETWYNKEGNTSNREACKS